MPWLRRLDVAGSVGHVRSPHLRQLFGRFATYIGSSPYLAPATLGVISHVELTQGVWYPQGGIFSIAHALHVLPASWAQMYGWAAPGGICAGRPCDRRHAVQWIVEADAVLANVDAAVCNRLLPQGFAPAHRARDLTTATLVLRLHPAARRRGEHRALAHHNIFFCRLSAGSSSTSSTGACRRRSRRSTCRSRPRPTPEDAPQGHENWYVLVNAPAGRTGVRLGRVRPAPTARWCSTSSRDFGLDVRDRIVTEQLITPTDLEARTGGWRGALYGELFDSPWVAFRRPTSRAGDIKGLYLAGGTTHPGGGVPMVMLSGKLAAKAVLEDLGVIMKSVIIIGAGMGGLAAALRLRKMGFDVTVLEKQKRPGGR